MPDPAGTLARIGEKQQDLTVPAATVLVLSPQVPCWLFGLILRELRCPLYPGAWRALPGYLLWLQLQWPRHLLRPCVWPLSGE